MTTSPTPTYDRLASTPGMYREHGRAISAGQRAGNRAVTKTFAPYEYEPFGSYDHTEIMQRAQAAASVASAAARERYAKKVLS